MSYNDFKTSAKAILAGPLSKKDFQTAQREDEFCSKILNSLRLLRQFVLVDGLLYRKRGGRIKLVLPLALMDIMINSKHFTVFGLHFSRSRILRDITNKYHVQMSTLKKRLKRLHNNCLICQFNTTTKVDQELRQSDYIYAPRVTWGVDLIPNMPLSNSNRKVAMLAVDLFTGYIQICPLQDRTAKSLIAGIEQLIIRPFCAPQYIRSDEEAGLFNSQEFYDFLKPRGIKYFPTSVGSPWANSTAERSVRTIKDAARNFFLQEKVGDEWEKYIDYFTRAHNQSASVYGFAPEELMFATTIPNANDLIQFWPNTTSHSDYMEKIVPLAENNRKIAERRAIEKRSKNRTYKNIMRTKKVFQLGQIVAHRQLQVATGSAMSLKPNFTGPYVIEELHDDKVSATITNLMTGAESKAHFNNLAPISYHPAANRLREKFDEELENLSNQPMGSQDTPSMDEDGNEISDLSQMLPSKYTVMSKTRRPVKIITFQEDPNVIIPRFFDDDGNEMTGDQLIDRAISTQLESDPIAHDTYEEGPNSQDPDYGQLIEPDDLLHERQLFGSQSVELKAETEEMSTEEEEETEEQVATEYFKDRIKFHKEFIEALRANWPKKVKEIESKTIEQLSEEADNYPSFESSSSSDIDSDY